MEDEQVKKTNNNILLTSGTQQLVDDGDKTEQEEEERVGEWETGLPTTTDLTPLSYHLISPELASAFSITAEPFQTMLDVNRASQSTLSNLRRQPSNNFKLLSSFMEDRCSDPDPTPTPVVVDEHQQQQHQHQLQLQLADPVDEADPNSKRKVDQPELDDDDDDSSARALKRPRLVWTPQLHKRFVDVVAHLGIDNAVPKTIMQLMNVEGLTRENVASHLQKYRLFLKRMSDGASRSSADKLFASTPIPQSLPSLAHGVPLQPRSTSAHASTSGSYNSFEFHPQGRFKEHQGLCPPNSFASILHHSHVSPNDK